MLFIQFLINTYCEFYNGMNKNSLKALSLLMLIRQFFPKSEKERNASVGNGTKETNWFLKKISRCLSRDIHKGTLTFVLLFIKCLKQTGPEEFLACSRA